MGLRHENGPGVSESIVPHLCPQVWLEILKSGLVFRERARIFLLYGNMFLVSCDIIRSHYLIFLIQRRIFLNLDISFVAGVKFGTFCYYFYLHLTRPANFVSNPPGTLPVIPMINPSQKESVYDHICIDLL